MNEPRLGVDAMPVSTPGGAGRARHLNVGEAPLRVNDVDGRIWSPRITGTAPQSEERRECPLKKKTWMGNEYKKIGLNPVYCSV